MKPPKRPIIEQLHKRYGFKCDALSHIDMIQCLTGISLEECAIIWDKIRSDSPDLLDETGNIHPMLLMDGTHEEFLSEKISNLLSPYDIYVKFLKPAPDSNTFLDMLETIWSNEGQAIITVSVHRETESKPLGHVVGMVKHKSRYFIHDCNLPQNIEIGKEDIIKMFDDPLKLWQNHSISLDKRFPIEALYLKKD